MIQPVKEHMFAEERQDKIVALLKKRGKLLIPSLCEYFSVSPATIRNDLNDMERKGMLKRTHGGAIPVTKTGFEPDFIQKQVKNSREKTAIAAAAAALVDDGDTIAIDTGTTALAFAAALSEKSNLTIITNDLKVAMMLDEQGKSTVIFAGGTVRHGFYCTVGTLVLQCLRNFRVDKSFLATNGLSIEAGLTTPDMGHAEIKRQMAEIGSQVFVLCDSTKIGSNTLSAVIPLEEVEAVITDDGIDREQLDALQKSGVEVIVA